MHIPVLLHESLEGLNIKPEGVYVDCTANRGGHSKEIAKLLGENGVLICVDLDQDALAAAREEIEKMKLLPKIHFIHSNFRFLPSILKDLKISHVDGILADLGVSSQELDESGRGFSFRTDEPLLMTFESKPEEDVTTAYDIVNSGVNLQLLISYMVLLMRHTQDELHMQLLRNEKLVLSKQLTNL